MEGKPIIYHGTPLTPRSALNAVMPSRAACVSFYHPSDADAVAAVCPLIMFDNGAFSEWRAALKRGDEWFIRSDWRPYYEWLESRLFHPGRWAVIPDAPGAPSQLNDSLIPEWPFGQKGAPLWHMDGPLDRLLRLCDKFDRVCLGWTGAGKSIDVPDYHRRMEDVSSALGNRWPVLHMMRGISVAFDYPFESADATTLAQNGWKYDRLDEVTNLWGETTLKWSGRNGYADRLECGNSDWRKRSNICGARRTMR